MLDYQDISWFKLVFILYLSFAVFIFIFSLPFEFRRQNIDKKEGSLIIGKLRSRKIHINWEATTLEQFNLKEESLGMSAQQSIRQIQLSVVMKTILHSVNLFLKSEW